MTPLGKLSGFLGLGVCCGVEQGARIRELEIPLSGILGHSAPILKEHSSLCPLVPFSEFSEFLDFFDIFDDGYFIAFLGIIVEDAGGVGLGEESAIVAGVSRFVESLTPAAELTV